MLLLLGRPALSAFRLERLSASLPIPLDGPIRCHDLYIVELDDHTEAAQVSALKQLLDHAQTTPQPLDHEADLIVLPRLGTQSAWSTKAHDACLRAGLDGVRRIELGRAWWLGDGAPAIRASAQALSRLHDRMTETVVYSRQDACHVFDSFAPAAPRYVDARVEALSAYNDEAGLGLSSLDIDYLAEQGAALNHRFSDAELTMYAQVNSEHCRHKTFNGDWMVDNHPVEGSLFDAIRRTQAKTPQNTLIAYRDNGAVLNGPDIDRWAPSHDRIYRREREAQHVVIKVETHNHPTAIAPFAGAATGSGGEIRDEGATGIGGKPKAGLSGFTVSDLRIPALPQPWELSEQHPERLATPLDIMIDGPLGAASFNNEFGRPGILGYFRTLEVANGDARYGYHKPIMIAGGSGSIRAMHVDKKTVMPGMKLVVLGGPGMRIGMGGGAASSGTSEDDRAELDFASVQRSNPEMERRCQEVIDRCAALGQSNPLISLHDVGAGGLSNALPELVEVDGCGALIRLADIPRADASLSPVELWCNESQERYVLVLEDGSLDTFAAIADREGCPWAVVGEATTEAAIRVVDDAGQSVVNLPNTLLFADPPPLEKVAVAWVANERAVQWPTISPLEALKRVLALPAVAAKHFLITIGDRSVTGLIHRDSMVGPWQVPVADCAITLADFDGFAGEAMAIGERPAVAIHNPTASVRLAIGEALTNLMAAPVDQLDRIKLSANWMAACGELKEDSALYHGVQAASEMCQQLSLAIPVGKDSLSMRVKWDDDHGAHEVSSPLSLVVTAFAALDDVRGNLTPQLTPDESQLVLIEPDGASDSLGATALSQVYGIDDPNTADVADLAALRRMFDAVAQLRSDGLLLAMHDRSDGGLAATLTEMVIASRIGLEIDLDQLGERAALGALFSESLGVVLQVPAAQSATVMAVLDSHALGDRATIIGRVNAAHQRLVVEQGGRTLIDEQRADLERIWRATSHAIQRLRDNPACADEEFADIADSPALRLTMPKRLSAHHHAVVVDRRPPAAILREQGVNSHYEMAAAFDAAGFRSVDVTMSDLLQGRDDLAQYSLLAACGGFSFGDVLGAGIGWARGVLYNAAVRDEFERFFARDDTLAIGICNGCQMLSLSALHPLLPNGERWPKVMRNRSEQYEGRVVQVAVPPNDNAFFSSLAGAEIPVSVAHAEGRFVFPEEASLQAIEANRQVVMRFVDSKGGPAQRYPQNPNGSPHGIAGIGSADGRVAVVMPHPERNHRTLANSWLPSHWDAPYGPWFELFASARRTLG
ncbi:phosphoribosylformylglycinamidine synthase [Gammaproteobacteria bacterium]|nr:phosphoribosylformylglycinamidine synthase [Gammaproteobacteria bacterium]